MSNEGVAYTKEQLIDIAMNAPHEFKNGNMELAWRMYSYREIAFFGETGRADLGCPLWRGESLVGKVLALCYEQTLGEQILFASMLPELQAMGATLIVEVDKRLIPLFERSFPGITFVPWGFPIDARMYKADYYTLMGNPGLRLRPNRESFPPNLRRYLKPKHIQGLNWPPTVGISWWSPATYNGYDKNVPLKAFEPIYRDDRLYTLNLQYGQPADSIPGSIPHDIDLINDIDGVASLVDACDVVITISNTVAHLAGALGKSTYILRPKHTEARLWYWDVPFYPTITRITKEDNQTWEEIIIDIHKKVLDK